MPKLIVVFDTNLLEGCKLEVLKVFLLDSICKLDGCCCRKEAFKDELPELEGCCRSSELAVTFKVELPKLGGCSVVTLADNGQNRCILSLLKWWSEGFKREDDRAV